MAEEVKFRDTLRVTTTDGSAVTTNMLTMPENSSGQFWAYVNAFEPATGDHKCWFPWSGIERPTGGSAGRIGSLIDIATPQTNDVVNTATWDADILDNGNSCAVRVTGELAKTIEWYVLLQGIYFVP